MSDKIKGLNEKRSELVRSIELAKKNKGKIEDFRKKLSVSFIQGKLSEKDYNKKIASKFNGRTISEWKKYYDSFVEGKHEKMKQIDQDIIEASKKGRGGGLRILVWILLILVIIISAGTVGAVVYALSTGQELIEVLGSFLNAIGLSVAISLMRLNMDNHNNFYIV